VGRVERYKLTKLPHSTSTISYIYEFEDHFPKNIGINGYKIKQIDHNSPITFELVRTL
jgi:hypothetical protein